jgi:hypothetical protein
MDAGVLVGVGFELRGSAMTEVPASGMRDAYVRKLRTTVTLEERILRAVRVKAARTGKRATDVIEEALRRDLGFDLLGRSWERAERASWSNRSARSIVCVSAGGSGRSRRVICARSTTR